MYVNEDRFERDTLKLANQEIVHMYAYIFFTPCALPTCTYATAKTGGPTSYHVQRCAENKGVHTPFC